MAKRKTTEELVAELKLFNHLEAAAKMKSLQAQVGSYQEATETLADGLRAVRLELEACLGPSLRVETRLVALLTMLCGACSAGPGGPMEPRCGDPGVVCYVDAGPGEQVPDAQPFGDAGRPDSEACPLTPVPVPGSCAPDPAPCANLGVACCQGYDCPTVPAGCQLWGTTGPGKTQVACGPMAAGYVGTPWDNGCVQQRSTDCSAATGAQSAFFCPDAQGLAGPNAGNCDKLQILTNDAGQVDGYEWCCSP